MKLITVGTEKILQLFTEFVKINFTKGNSYYIDDVVSDPKMQNRNLNQNEANHYLKEGDMQGGYVMRLRRTKLIKLNMLNNSQI